MMKYQEPEMDIIKFESASVIVTSGDGDTLYESGNTTGNGESTGGNGGGGWDGF